MLTGGLSSTKERQLIRLLSNAKVLTRIVIFRLETIKKIFTEILFCSVDKTCKVQTSMRALLEPLHQPAWVWAWPGVNLEWVLGLVELGPGRVS
jgi:hypothetical protein